MATFQLQDFLKHVSELSTISPVAVELINKINLPNTTRKDIASLVAKDEILYANIFKYVNSAAFPAVRRPQNIGQAVDLLGTNEVRTLVFAIAARKAFVDLDLWYRSVFTAVAAHKFGRIKDYSQDEVSNIYILGLMQSLGEQIFTIFYKQEYDPIKATNSYVEKLKMQKEVFGLTCIELSAEILKDFGLPDVIVELIDKQKLDLEDENFEEINALIYLAASLSELDPEDLSEEKIEECFDANLTKKFSLEELGVNLEMVEDLHEETKSFVNI